MIKNPIVQNTSLLIKPRRQNKTIVKLIIYTFGCFLTTFECAIWFNGRFLEIFPGPGWDTKVIQCRQTSNIWHCHWLEELIQKERKGKKVLGCIWPNVNSFCIAINAKNFVK